MVVYNGGDPQKRCIDSKLYKYRVQKPWIKAVQSDGVFLQQAFLSETINFEREIRRVWTHRSINWLPYGIRKMIAVEFTEVLHFRSRLEAVIKDINQLKKFSSRYFIKNNNT